MNKVPIFEKIRLPTSPEARKNRRDHLVPAVLGLGAAAAVLTIVGPKIAEATGNGVSAINNGINSIGEKIHGPAFSDELIVTQVSDGDTVWHDIVPLVHDPRDHATEGEIKTYIIHLPANAETFEDGQLSQGEIIFYPDHVK